MLGEITHLQTISEDLKSLTMDPHKLPSSSEQVRTVDRVVRDQSKKDTEFRALVIRVASIVSEITPRCDYVVHIVTVAVIVASPWVMLYFHPL
jgi:hypothetical protein